MNTLTKKNPRELKIEEIGEITKNFVDACRRAYESGYDLVQLNAGHGWLLSNFLSPFTNKRKDEYGGDTKGRVKILIDIYDKVNPYLRPLYDALYEMLDIEKFQQYRDMGIIEVVPLAYMRGRTLNDSFIILDEAQNTSPEQMKMFLTRLGFGSKIVVTGDITQIDLPHDKESGLIIVKNILGGIHGIEFVYLSSKDVVRHELVQRIVDAYKVYGEKNKK